MDKYKRKLSRSFSLINKPTHKDESQNESGGGNAGWRFWRRFSTRSHVEQPAGRSKFVSGGKERPEITLLEDHAEAEQRREGLLEDQATPQSSVCGSLPDVVKKAPGPSPHRLTGPNGAAPPKPPRNFLYRTPSSANKLNKNDNSTEPIYDNCYGSLEDPPNVRATSIVTQPQASRSPPQASRSPIRISQLTEQNNNLHKSTRNGVVISSCIKESQSIKHIPKIYTNDGQNSPSLSDPVTNTAGLHVTLTSEDCDTQHRDTQHRDTQHGKTNNNASNQTEHTAPVHADTGLSSTTSPSLLCAISNRKPKIRSPDLSSRRHHHHSRSRRPSDNKPGVRNSRQWHIMTSISELLRQTLDPYPLLEPLKKAGILNNVDVQGFLGHQDRKTVCENLVHILSEADFQALSTFSDILANSGKNSEIYEVLQVMREMDRIVHEVPSAPPEETQEPAEEGTGSKALEEEKLRYEVGYLAPDLTLRPLVELERTPRHSKRMSHGRNSTYSLLEGNTESGCLPGLVMISICVTGFNLSGQRTNALTDILSQQRCVCELRVGKTHLRGKDIAQLATALSRNSTVHSLDLRLNYIDSCGSESLSRFLHETKTLRELNLSSCGLTKDNLRTIASAVENNRSLQDLDLSFLDINDESAQSLKDMLRRNVGLRKLRLRSNSFTWSGCYILMEGVAKSMSLHVFDLSRNTLSNSGMQALAKFLPDTNITELHIENCGVTGDGCEHLSDVIARCKTLKTVDASTNLLADAGVCKLASALERSSSMENIGLNMCGITNDGFFKLLDVLEKNTSLLQVKLCYNHIDHSHFTNPQATLEILKYRLKIVTSSRPKLKILLWGNGIDKE